MSPQIAELKLSAIRESPLNPRRTYNERTLAELAASVAKVGVLQPVTVRTKHAGLKDGYELIYGHRRFRASRLAGLETIPAIVREMDDAAALEAMVIENGQREDVLPLEEADGYSALLRAGRCSVAEIAAKVDKSEAHIYQRLKLLDLPDVAKEALEQGELALSVALAIARIHDPKARVAAAKEVCTPREVWEYEGGKQRLAKVALSAADALKLIKQKFALRFDDCGFSLEDATLVPAAGSCADCPKRTKNAPLLFPDMESQDRCSDPPCFESKKAASLEQRRRAAEAAGRRVLGEKELKGVFHAYGNGELSYDSPYIDPRSRCNEDPKGRTYAQLLGKELPEKVLAIDSKSGVALDLVAKKQVLERLKKVRPELAPKRQTKLTDEEGKKHREAKLKAGVAQTAIGRVVKHAELDDAQGQLFWDLIAAGVIRETWDEVHRAVLARRELELDKRTTPRKALERLAAGMTAGQLRGLIVEVLVTRDAAPRHYSGAGMTSYGDSLKAACELYAVDLKKLEAEAKASQKEPRSANG